MLLAGCVAAASANVGESPSFDTPHDSAPRNATLAFSRHAYVTKLSDASHGRCAQSLRYATFIHMELSRHSQYNDVGAGAHDAHCGHKTRNSVVSGSGSSIGILVQFAFYNHGDILDRRAMGKSPSSTHIYSSTTDANLSVIFCRSSSYCLSISIYTIITVD